MTTARRGGRTEQKAKTEKVPIPFRLPEEVKKAVVLQAVFDGYGMKGKSRWISEAIEQFLQDPSWKAQVLDGEMVRGNSAKEVIKVDQEVADSIDAAVQELTEYWAEEIREGRRTDDPAAVNIPLAAIVRGAIIFRLYSLSMPKLSSEREPGQGDLELEPSTE